jgi:uncharacterized protein (TIGR02284 family)
METIEKSVEVLNDLIEINNDRVAGFGHAMKELEGNDGDLQAIFETYSQESRQNVHELSRAVDQLGTDADVDATSSSGAIHRAWLDVKATFSGHDRKSILEECERGEDAIKKAYKSALTDDNSLSGDLVQLITTQQQGIIAAHDKIKAMRDSEA